MTMLPMSSLTVFYQFMLNLLYSSYFGCIYVCLGDVEHTHLVKGLDYALLNKVRSEIDKKPDDEDDVDGKSRYLNSDYHFFMSF